MAEAWTEIQAEAPRQLPLSSEQLLRRLIQAETTDRQARSLRYQLHTAKFPIHRDLVHFDWSETPLSRHYIEQLANAGFMADAHNPILVGGTGTGKTHLATACGWRPPIKASACVFITPWICSIAWNRKNSRTKLAL